MIDNGGNSKPTAAFQRVVQRAVQHALGLGRADRRNTIVAIFPERESPAARLLHEQGMSHQEAANIAARGAGKGGAIL